MKPEIIDGFKFQKGIDGSRKLIIESSKLDACIKYVLDGNIRGITINSIQGYELDDISFLGLLVEVLEELHLPETKFNNQIINSLLKLKVLGFADNGKDVVNLSNFPKLERLATNYSPRLKHLGTCTSMTDLTLTGYKSKKGDLFEIPFLHNLRQLCLFKPQVISLKGAERFIHLKTLEIFLATKLETLMPLQALSRSLEKIQIEKCKNINDFESLGKLESLKKLILSECGQIKSLSFLRELPLLEFISFWGTNILDGNIGYCEGVNYVGFDNKKHYSHKLENFR